MYTQGSSQSSTWRKVHRGVPIYRRVRTAGIMTLRSTSIIFVFNFSAKYKFTLLISYGTIFNYCKFKIKIVAPIAAS
ncbi:unnamed protein product [marine sediment metagenome]|uniref:Uncharacterized protein n=1 Tax=marine sediment metagenome TaxID=412755 RepID=X1KQK8_9ZZZZ